MNLFDTSQTSTLTQSALIPNQNQNGKVSALSYSAAMDIDTDLQHHHRPQTNSKMDSSPDTSQLAPVKPNEPETPASTPLVALAAKDRTPFSDRPKVEEAQQSSSQAPLLPQRSPLTQNLISLFDLQPLAATVARTDPVTGEKINKMRKSYEGHLKTLGLAGRNRSVKHEEGKVMGLREMTLWPEEEWQNQKVGGKDVHNGLSSGILAKLDRAMQMQPGSVPNNNEWEDLLGHDKPKPVEPNARASKLPSIAIPKANGQVNGNNANAEVVRPKRSGKKRTYEEHSFEGYGEGYVDDDLDIGGGYSSGDTQFSRKSANSKKKRKKDYGISPTGYGDRTGSFNSGMVGVSTYGR